MNTEHFATRENLTEVKLFKVYIFILMRKVLLSGFMGFPFLRLWGELRDTFLTCNVVRFPETDSYCNRVSCHCAHFKSMSSQCSIDILWHDTWWKMGWRSAERDLRHLQLFLFNFNLLESKLMFENCLWLKSPWLLLPCSRSFLWDYNHTISSALHTHRR